MYLFLNKIQRKLIKYSDKLDRYQNFYVHKNFLDKAACDELIGLMKEYEMKETKVNINNESVRDTAHRKGNEVPLPLEDKTLWIYDKLERAVRSCNTHAYDFKLIGFTQSIRVLEYKVGDHYQTWHQDFGRGRTSTRKLSVSIQLSDPSEYEGGALEFFNGDFIQAPREQGSLVIFPSFVFHRVVSVTEGTRHSLVAWMNGPHFS